MLPALTRTRDRREEPRVGTQTFRCGLIVDLELEVGREHVVQDVGDGVEEVGGSTEHMFGRYEVDRTERRDFLQDRLQVRLPAPEAGGPVPRRIARSALLPRTSGALAPYGT